MSIKDKPKRPLSGVWKLEHPPLSSTDQSLLHATMVRRGRNSVHSSSKTFLGLQSLPSTTPRLVRQIADLRFQEWHTFTKSLPQINIDHGDKQTTAVHQPIQSVSKDTHSMQVDKSYEAKKLPRNAFGLPFLRRPTIPPPTPAPENGDFFKVILKGKEMKPYSFHGDELKVIQFYASHFPLLMRKLLDTRGSLPGSAKAITGSDVLDALKVDSADVRRKRLHEWLASMEECLRLFETDPEDEGAIETVLRSEIFDPSAWPWNSEKYKLPDITNGTIPNATRNQNYL